MIISLIIVIKVPLVVAKSHNFLWWKFSDIAKNRKFFIEGFIKISGNNKRFSFFTISFFFFFFFFFFSTILWLSYIISHNLLVTWNLKINWDPGQNWSNRLYLNVTWNNSLFGKLLFFTFRTILFLNFWRMFLNFPYIGGGGYLYILTLTFYMCFIFFFFFFHFWFLSLKVAV